MSRRTFQLRAIVATIAPHQAATSLRQTSEDASFSSQGGIIANATLALGGAGYVFAVRPFGKGKISRPVVAAQLITEARTRVNRKTLPEDTQKCMVTCSPAQREHFPHSTRTRLRAGLGVSHGWARVIPHLRSSLDVRFRSFLGNWALQQRLQQEPFRSYCWLRLRYRCRR